MVLYWTSSLLLFLRNVAWLFGCSVFLPLCRYLQVYQCVLIKMSYIRSEFSLKVEHSKMLRIFLVALVLIFMMATLVCGFYLCTRQKLADVASSIIQFLPYFQDAKKKVEEEFGVAEVHHWEYILLQIKDINGQTSIFDLITIANHHILVITSSLVIFFCSYNINSSIRLLRRMGTSLRRIKMQRQLFVSLVLQVSHSDNFCQLFRHWYRLFFATFRQLFSYRSLFWKLISPLDKFHFYSRF